MTDSRDDIDLEPEDLVARLSQENQLQPHAPAAPVDLAQFEHDVGVHLPGAHRRLLLLTNGFEAFRGYFRMLGVGLGASIDMRKWNDLGLWKFAYRGAADDFLSFAELGNGDQFAYRYDELCSQTEQPMVHRLLANDMSVVYVDPRFTAFLGTPILKGVLLHDRDFVHWMSRLGDLESSELVGHRSFGVLDAEGPEYYEKMDSVEAMIYGGDAWNSERPPGAEPDHLEYYIDGHGRRRLRVVWR